jgi:hypothetical protein
MKYLLTSASVLALLVQPALAAKTPQFSELPNHRFSGGIELRAKSDSNVGATPGQQGTRFEDFDTDTGEDDADLNDDFGDEMLDDLVDDSELNFEDLEEQDDGADEDADGNDDALDANSGPASRRDSDLGASAKLGLGHAYTINKRVQWKTAALVNGTRQDDRDDLERYNWALNTGPVIKLSKSFSMQPSLTYAENSQDGDRKTDSWIGSLGAAWKASKQLKLQGRYNYQSRDVVDARGADADVNGLKLGAKYRLTAKDVLAFAFSPNLEDNSRAAQDKDRYGLELGYNRKLPWKLGLAASVRRTYTDYTNLGREDTQSQYALGLQKKFARGLYSGIAVDYAERDSNIEGKDFENTSFLLTSGWKF